MGQKDIWSEVFCAGEGQQEQVMALVDAFQETRQTICRNDLGYLQGVDVLLQHPDSETWEGWHKHATFFASSTKHRSRAKVYMANSPSS